MARSKQFARSANTKSLLYPSKEPKKSPQIHVVKEVDIVEEYSNINQVPEHLRKEYIRRIMED